MTSHKSTPGVGDAAWTEQESQLLGAARHERMPSHLEARMREALELQLGAATISGVHDARAVRDTRDVTPASSPSQLPEHAPQLSQPSVGLDRAARVSQLFSSKLPLWGVLCVVAFGSIAYFGLRGSATQAVAGVPLAAAESTHNAALTRTADSTSAPTARAANERVARSSAAAVQMAEAPPASSGSAPRDQARTQRSAAASRPVHAAASGNRRASGSPRGFELPGSVAAAQSGKARTLDSVDPGVSAAVANHAAVGVPAAPPDAAPSGSAQNGAGASVDELRLEAELLDKARRALSRGALPEARRLLGQYSARFERGVLRPESDVLGIELEMRTGSASAAESHAARFLASYPKHPLRERVRELVANRAATAVE